MTDAGDHGLVRDPDNPLHHWGNLALVTDAAAVGDADRWRAAFAAAFPEAEHVAVGLVAAPDAAGKAAWAQTGAPVTLDVVLAADRMIEQRPVPDCFVVRRLDGAADRDRQLAFDLRFDADQDGHEPVGFRAFAEARAATRRSGLPRSAARAG